MDKDEESHSAQSSTRLVSGLADSIWRTVRAALICVSLAYFLLVRMFTPIHDALQDRPEDWRRELWLLRIHGELFFMLLVPLLILI